MQAFRDLAADVCSILEAGTAISYATDWNEYFGHQPGYSSGDVFFHLDLLWADPEIDFVGIDNYMPLSDWRNGFEHPDAVEGWPAIYDRAYLQENIAVGEGFDWFYASAADRSVQARTPITDGAAGKPWVFGYKDMRAWWSSSHYDRPGGVESATPTVWTPQSKPIWFTELGCPAIDRGTNQPNVFFDPKSSESFVTYFSRSWRDDAIQRADLEATYLWWGEAANNPLSSVYGGRMVHVPECAAWTWDARPYPFFPALTDVWTDGAHWRLGHWLTCRLGAVSLAALVRYFCLRAGLPEAEIEGSGIWGPVETEGVIRFVTLAHDDRAVPLRLVSIANADARGIEAVRQDREAYDLSPGAARPSTLSQTVVFGAPEAVLLDLPQLTEDQPAYRPFAAAHSAPWSGEIAVFSNPSTDGCELLTTFGSRAWIGALVSDLYAGPTSRFDLGNVLVIDLLNGTLESVTDLTLFGGANALDIESAPGTWEIVLADAAELIALGRYRLHGLLRGQRGTESAMGNPAPVGARVIVLNESLTSLPISEADLSIPWNWRIGLASRPVSDETYVAQAFTPEGIGLRPFSVAHVEQPWRRPRTPDDLTIRWTRRSRVLAADNWSGLEVPLAEELEAYEVEILDGGTVKRVLSTATTRVVYTSAQQAADWGAPLGPGDSLTVRIFQLSALVGRGAPKTVTLLF